MPPFPKPPPFNFLVEAELNNLKTYRKTKPGRAIPKVSSKKLLIATWNIANFSTQDREVSHLALIAEMISWFDLIAVQEINDDLAQLRLLQTLLPKKYKVIFTDVSGNNERMCFIYNASKMKLAEKIGEIDIPAEDLVDIKLPGNDLPFNGFSRAPYFVTFSVSKIIIAFVNVHSYFGKENDGDSMKRRSLEAYAIARWADLRRKSKYSYTSNILALGDFNLPKVEVGDPVYEALLSRGLELPEHTTKIYSNIADDKHYDQIAFLPGLKSKMTNGGVFDFDGALFPNLYDPNAPLIHRNYIRYYISDHRIKWLELDLSL